MSVGCFLGVRAAFDDDADRHLTTISETLRRAGLPAYEETLDRAASEARYSELHREARCSIDTVGASLQPLARMIVRSRGAAAGPFKDFAVTTDRIFVPGEFEQRLEAVRLPGHSLWSIGALRVALRQAALVLGIPLVGGEVPDSAIKRIDSLKKLSKNDPVSSEDDEYGYNTLEHYRPTWLTLSEFCNVAHKHGVALALAG